MVWKQSSCAEEIMEENIQNEEIITIDIGQYVKKLKKSWKLIVLSIIICAAIAYALTAFLIPKKYASSSSIYLVPKIDTKTGVVDFNALNANSKQVNNYMYMLKGENILSEVAKELGIANVNELTKAISVSNTANTEIIKVKATTNDPKKSQQIVEVTINTFFNEVKTKLDVKNMTILDNATVNPVPVSPNKKLNIIIGILIGILGSCGYVFLKFIFDKRLTTKADAEKFLGIPVLAEIPFYEE